MLAGVIIPIQSTRRYESRRRKQDSIFYSLRATISLPASLSSTGCSLFILLHPSFAFHFAASASFLQLVVRSRTANVSAWILMSDPCFNTTPPTNPRSSWPGNPGQFSSPSRRGCSNYPSQSGAVGIYAGSRNANSTEVVWHQEKRFVLHFHKTLSTDR